MQRRATRRLSVTLTMMLGGVVAWMLLYHECASGGAMGGWYRTCTCRGIERVDFDATASDGPLRTVCLGWVTARACFRSRGGPEMQCE